jgi:hypothetical protein
VYDVWLSSALSALWAAVDTTITTNRKPSTHPGLDFFLLAVFIRLYGCFPRGLGICGAVGFILSNSVGHNMGVYHDCGRRAKPEETTA